ncbi:hypothetical protein [Micromonospora sp. NPDC047074]
MTDTRTAPGTPGPALDGSLPAVAEPPTRPAATRPAGPGAEQPRWNR